MSSTALSPPGTSKAAGDQAPRRRATPGWPRALRLIGLLAAVAALGAVVLLSVSVGTRDIPLSAVWSLLWSHDGSDDAVIVYDYRLPRTLLGALVGSALGLAGALMQALTRNPLADPGLLGVNMGASTGVVAAIAFLGVSTVTGYIWCALLGAAAASILVYLLGSAGPSATAPERLVLAGTAMTAVLFSFNTAVLLANPRAFDRFRFWNVGSLAGRSWDVLAAVLPCIVLGSLIALALMRALNVLAMGDQLSQALGVRIGLTRGLGAGAVVLLCGAATAAAGPIGFVGLAVPHAARVIVGPDQRWVLPYSMLLAPALLLGADVMGRILGAPGELQVGIVTALLGGPVFIALCRRRRVAAP